MKQLNFGPGNTASRVMLAALVVGISLASVSPILAEESKGNRREPVYRVSRATPETNTETPEIGRHPLDPALEMAQQGLDRIRDGIRDYRCILVKRERIKGELGEYEYMFTKVRNRQFKDGKQVVPFSVYMYFLKPSHTKGREVIYVEGQNNGKLCAHEGGTKGKFLPTVWLQPDSMLAMQGQLYPITDVGIENLVLKLLERGERERQFPDVEVAFKKDARVNDRVCTVLEIRHPTRRPEYEFYYAQVFIDDELGIPIRYVAYGWPEGGSAEPPVLEEYTYLKLEINVGLTAADFDPKNKDYNF